MCYFFWSFRRVGVYQFVLEAGSAFAVTGNECFAEVMGRRSASPIEPLPPTDRRHFANGTSLKSVAHSPKSLPSQPFFVAHFHFRFPTRRADHSGCSLSLLVTGPLPIALPTCQNHQDDKCNQRNHRSNKNSCPNVKASFGPIRFLVG
jgi:hypothetical protein